MTLPQNECAQGVYLAPHNMSKIIASAPNKFIQIYLERIKADMKEVKPSPLLNKIVSEYFLLKYGEDARNEARKEYTEQIFKDY